MNLTYSGNSGKPKPKNPVTIESRDGVLVAKRERLIVRFLFSDGTTLDVETDQDDSWLRAAILAYARKERIEGFVYLPSDTSKAAEATPAPTKAKRVVKKQA